MDYKIKQFVYKIRARLREQEIISSLLFTAEIGLLLAVVISVISLVVPFYHTVLAALGVMAVSIFTGFVVGIRKTPSPMEAALRADAKGHKEKIATAFFLKGKEDAFSTLQKQDALNVAENFLIRKEFPISLPLKRTLMVFGLAVIFMISSVMDTPAREHAGVKHEVAEEAKEDIARLEKVEKKLAESKEISKEEVEEIKEQIERSKKELLEADSREDLKKAEERITKKIEMAEEKTQNKALGDIMSEAAKEEKKAAEQKRKEREKAAKEALAKAETGSKKDKQEAYEQLKKLAAAMDATELAKAAEEYKDSGFSDSDYAQAQRALEETLDSASQGQTDLANNSSNNEESNSNNGNQSNNQNSSEKSGGENQNSSQNGNSGKGDGEQGSSGQGGKNGSGNGTGTGSGDSGKGWNRGSKEGSKGAKKTNETITIPEGEIGKDENLTGKANGNNSGTKEKSSQSKTWSGNKVSYGEVSGTYKEKAYKKVNGSNYPGKLKDKIKNYFDGLH